MMHLLVNLFYINPLKIGTETKILKLCQPFQRYLDPL
jgi:hypothetical protein